MVFLANTGPESGDLEQATDRAAASALSAAADIFKLLARLEQAGADGISMGGSDLQGVQSQLQAAAQTYRKLSLRDVTEAVQLTQSDLERAAVFDTGWTRAWSRYDGEYFDTNRALAELADRLKAIAELIDTFAPGQSRESLAPLVFKIMRDWEVVMRVGRLLTIAFQKERRLGS